MPVRSGGGVNSVGVKGQKKNRRCGRALHHGILCSPQFRSHQETKMAACRTRRSTYISRKITNREL